MSTLMGTVYCVPRFAPHILYPIKKHRLSLYEQSLCFFLFLFLPGRSGIILVPFIVFGQNGCEIRDQPPAVSRGSRMAGRGPQVASSRHPATSSQPRSAICESRSADCGFRFPKYMLWGCNLPSALSRQPSAVVRDLRPAACGLRTARERLPYKHTKRDL